MFTLKSEALSLVTPQIDVICSGSTMPEMRFGNLQDSSSQRGHHKPLRNLVFEYPTPNRYRPIIVFRFPFSRNHQHKPFALTLSTKNKSCKGRVRLIQGHAMQVNLAFGNQLAAL